MRRLAIALAMGLSLATAGACVATGKATPALSAASDSGLVWLASSGRDAVTAVDVTAARPVAEVAGDTVTDVQVSQSGSGSFLLDQRRRTLTIVHADTLSADSPLSIPKLLPGKQFQPSLAMAVGSEEQLALIDEQAGRLALLRGSRLANPLPLGGRVSAAVLDGDGVGWLAVGRLGTVVAVAGTSVSAPLRVCTADCALTVVAGRAQVLDTGTGAIAELALSTTGAPSATPRATLPLTGDVLLAGAEDGTLAMLDPDAETLQTLYPDGTTRGLSGVTGTHLALVGERAVLSDGRAAWLVDVRTGARNRLDLAGSASADLELVPTPSGVVLNDRAGDRAILITADGERTLVKYDPTVAAAAVRPGTPVAAPTAATTAGARQATSTPTRSPSSSGAPTATPTSSALPSIPVSTGAVLPSPPSPTGPASTTPSTGGPQPTQSTQILQTGGPTPSTQSTQTSEPTPNTPTTQPTQTTPTTQQSPTTTSKPAPTPAPGRPSLVQKVSTSPLGLTLDYQASGVITNWRLAVFNVEAPGNPVQVSTVPAAQTSATLHIPSCGRYFAQVSAIGPGGQSDSAAGDATLVCPELSQVSGLTGQQSSAGLTLTWTPPTGVDGLSQTVRVASTAGTLSYDVATAATLSLPSVPSNALLRVTVTATDRWQRWVATSTEVHTVPTAVGVCGTFVGTVVKPYWRWQTWTTCPGGGDLRVYTEPAPDLGITTELWVATNAAGNQRLLTRVNGQVSDDLGAPAGFSLSGTAPLGYLPSADLPGVTSTVIAAYTVSHDTVTSWAYTAGPPPVPAPGLRESVLAQGRPVVGAT